MLAKTFGSAVIGVNAISIGVEVNITSGTHYFIVGLPDSAVKESLLRVESAIVASGGFMPRQKLVVNLSPADIRKEGSAYDLPIALAILAASNQIPLDSIEEFSVMGELSMEGNILPIKGALSMAIHARNEKRKGFILSKYNAREAAIVGDLQVYGSSTLLELISFFRGKHTIIPEELDTRNDFLNRVGNFEGDFSEVKGQENIKRALEIASAGGHNVLLIGPPGAGKTMLAKRLPSILPPLTLRESLETTKIHSVAGKMGKEDSLISVRPFRSPHHTISDMALVGGGAIPQPGEISLAHNGVLFLDELPEFKRSVLEVMRQPLEDGKVNISRARFSVDYPASFMLVGAMNPCPCGYFNHPSKECQCGFQLVQKYMSRISGPLMDRIDLHIEVTPVEFGDLSTHRPTEKSEQIRERVIIARQIQNKRFVEVEHIHCNSQMTHALRKKYCALDSVSSLLIQRAMEKLGLSARAYDKILKVSRTIADLDSSEKIKVEHIAEAIQYRSLDRDSWGQ